MKIHVDSFFAQKKNIPTYKKELHVYFGVQKVYYIFQCLRVYRDTLINLKYLSLRRGNNKDPPAIRNPEDLVWCRRVEGLDKKLRCNFYVRRLVYPTKWRSMNCGTTTSRGASAKALAQKLDVDI